MSTGGLLALGPTSGFGDGLVLLAALSAFTFICSIEAILSSERRPVSEG